MDTYSALRHFADSWGLLAMFVFFVGMLIWLFRPGSKHSHDNAASIPLRNDDAPAAARAPEAPAQN
ncbi:MULTISPECIES: CcoQ/FixQ family Cbb3-type cytochrome c oxidase assembly chaperone [Roseobacteraceae]|uniref:CcoQ/FixQ family Cbb3-type cytochrome c oxidase assembly chaperone n=1 Tax=Roseobacteraceae TaxID=2854170 RepID=UPI00080ABFBD|nr:MULTISPECIES: CcoQ/FixQ family Cbb3-type cytochrome c oxidase assembly chaperone [Roseobacteraceae]ANT59653.1 cytochrome oxidase [Salipiger sp. CCB-MM3]MCA0998351.1 CcoQ/FixQ family Cbb3-type cytochrome c oxidase assembly chaperone [Alloyangia pacifica]NDW00635.1 CcoQ/FixQ family Cbb3-type cytochrome c oxidase assembly chaperone [Salipiger sp. PrR002]NDW57770.1 CcoQ/FixQ family Cbb3-type cytochrome c oxidase assembly chaperone [Salipiger sp. PrR004]